MNSPRYRDSQTKLGWDEHVCAASDVIASEDHSHIAARWERSRNENSWKLVLNSEGANGPVDQRGDYKEAKTTCDRMYREYAATAGYVNTRIHPQDQVRQRPEQQFEGHEEDSYRIDAETEWKCHEFFFFIILVATIRQLVDSIRQVFSVMD